jgi:hypothetical protein
LYWLAAEAGHDLRTWWELNQWDAAVVEGTKMSAPVAMRKTTDAVYEAIRYEEGPLAADLFVVPADWTEAPAQWLPQRVLQFLKPPAAIQ